ncbi:MAG: hypothetical protein AABX50_01600 [Nanoarchaeota archaeon]
MPLCGFNQKMLEGLVAFQEGLVEHGILERSTKKGQTPDRTLADELSDMTGFLAETGRIKDPKIREVTEALTRYAEAFYKIVESRGVDNYKDTVRALNDFYVKMDDKFYQELEGKPEDMRQLAEYLNKVAV